MIETWRPISGYEGLYEVSDGGSVRSLDRVIVDRGGNRKRKIRGRLIKGSLRPSGHHQLTLQRDGRKHTRDVHRLVLEAFVGPCPDGMECCHRNGNPADNRVENLYWGTRSDNLRDAVTHGTHAMSSKTHCKHGHEYTPENTITRVDMRGGKEYVRRNCRECHRIKSWARLHGVEPSAVPPRMVMREVAHRNERGEKDG